ncbi:MAG: LamG-like jellyroll fold domain-containing protein, partial [Bacteroidota bacterium]
NNDTTIVALSTISKVAGNALIANGTAGNPAGSSIRFASRPEMIGNTTTAFTAEAWVKLTSNTVDQKFVSKSNVNNGFCIGILTAGAKFDPEIWTVANGTGSVRMTTTGVSLPNNTIPANQWTHLAVTWESGVGVKAYINGSLVGYLSSTTVTTISQSAADLFLGANSWDFGYPTLGAIDEVRLWTVALDSIALRRNMHRTLSGTEPGLTTYIQLNEGVSSTLFGDAVGGAVGYRNTAAAIAPATMPLGGDSSLTMTGVLSGTFYNGAMTLNVYDAFDNACDLTLTEINNAPNTLPTATHIYNNRYWVVRPFGNPGSFLADMTLTFTLGQLNVSDPALRLYRRGYNSDSAWTFYKTSGSILTTSVTFNMIDTFGQFTVASNGTSPLPVSLLSFGGKRNNDVVNLNWVTASEINCRGFEIERSYTGEDFETIGNVDAIGNYKGTKSSYVYTDEKADLNQTIYYRLKQVDLDGKYSYSPVVVITTIEGDDKNTVYPNPFNTEFSVRVHSGAEATAVVRVVDITGKEMHMKSHAIQSGSTNITIDGAAFKTGLYFVTIELNGEKQTIKVNKQ